jgi:hypothetical protein
MNKIATRNVSKDTAMSFWYPRIPRRELFAIMRIAVLGGGLAGVYGACHDQVSYSISPEYFTKVKFRQFFYADFGLPDRVFAAEVGFLAAGGVGVVAGWLLARAGLAELSLTSRRYSVAEAFAIVALVDALTGCAAALLGVSAADGDLSGWKSWQESVGVQDLRGFVIVAYLHWGSYLGALLGVLAALTYVRWNRE